MENNIDFYLGSFLILCGFSLSLLNLRRIVKGGAASFPAVLLSENVLLTCIGVAFISRSIYKLSPMNSEIGEIQNRSGDMKNEDVYCGFLSIIMSYGPLIVSLVNSFLSLIIDNYMHYRMIADVKKNEDVNTVRELNDDFRVDAGNRFKNVFKFIQKYFSFITIGLQWILPILIALSMYSIDVKEMTILDSTRSLSNTCMALVDAGKENCSLQQNENVTVELRNYLQNLNYLPTQDIAHNSSAKIDTVVKNVYEILGNLQNHSHYSDVNVTTALLIREPKTSVNEKCMKICYMENKDLLLYMFGVSVVCYFVPITISTIILTKIHMMEVQNKNVKMYVSRELLYNTLFWTPVMFDTFLSITLCSFTMNGTRTSIFNVIANVYQAVKNFMNTKYFKDNIVVPV